MSADLMRGKISRMLAHSPERASAASRSELLVISLLGSLLGAWFQRTDAGQHQRIKPEVPRATAATRPASKATQDGRRFGWQEQPVVAV